MYFQRVSLSCDMSVKHTISFKVIKRKKIVGDPNRLEPKCVNLSLFNFLTNVI